MDEELELSADFWRPSPVMVELLFEVAPTLDDHGDIAARAAERAGSRTEVIGDDDGSTRGIAFPGITVPFAEGAVPLAIWLMPAGDRTIDTDTWIEGNLRQTWAWDGAEAAVRRAGEALLVTDLVAGPLDHRIRLPAYQAVLGAAVEILGPGALWFVLGERFVEPAPYLRDLDSDPAAFESTVNVRFVTITNRPGEQLMDSVGMKPFGLPDIQLNFTTLDPTWVAGKILGTARYLFDNGDVIEDGNTVPGLRDGERWPCTHELPMMGPQREVLDIDPSPYGPVRG
jgi:hypothetical protein